jgi:hypothetical protein
MSVHFHAPSGMASYRKAISTERLTEPLPRIYDEIEVNAIKKIYNRIKYHFRQNIIIFFFLYR